MRVLVLSNKCPPDYDGGYELSAFQVASALRERGYDVHLATSHYRPTYTGERSDPDWVHRIFDYREWEHLGGHSGPLRAWRDARRIARMTNIGWTNAEKLRAFLSGWSPDLAYCFGLQGVGLATAAPLAEQGIPILWHAGNYLIAEDLELRSPFKRKRIVHRLAMRLLASKAYSLLLRGDYRHIAFLSEHVRARFQRRGVSPKGSYIIPRGIEFPIVEDLDRAREPVFLIASRLADEKGIPIALDAAAQLHARDTAAKWELHIAGSGTPEYIDRIRRTVAEKGLADRVRLLGMLTRAQVLERMRDSWAFLSTSVWEEPFGRTNIEAMACSTPLIAADTGAIREIVGQSECALIYPRRDPAALSEAMHRILEETGLRRELAKRGLERVREAFTLERILDLTEDVFGQVMHAHGKPFNRPARERSPV